MRSWWLVGGAAALVGVLVVGCLSGPSEGELSEWADYRVLVSTGNWEPGSSGAGEVLGVDAEGEVARLSQVGIDDGKLTVDGSALLVEGDATAQWVDGGAVREISHPGDNGLHMGSVVDGEGDRAVSVFNKRFAEDGSHYLSPAFWYRDGKLAHEAVLPWNILSAPVACGDGVYVPIDNLSLDDLMAAEGAGVARLDWDGTFEPFWFEGDLAGLDTGMSDGPACMDNELMWVAMVPENAETGGLSDGPLVVVRFDVGTERVEATPLTLDGAELRLSQANINTSSYVVDGSLVWASEDGGLYATQVDSGVTTRRGRLPKNFTDNNVQMYVGEHGLSVLAEDRSADRLILYRVSPDGEVAEEVSLDEVLPAVGKNLAWQFFVDLQNRPTTQ